MKKLNYFELRTRTALAKFYGISLGTLQKKLKPIAKKLGLDKVRIFSPKQLEEILNYLGNPV